MDKAIPSTIRFTLPEPLPDEQRQQDGPFGLNLQMELRHWTFAEMRKAMHICRQMGITWSREELHWAHIMPRRGVFRWKRIDKSVELTLAAGVNIMGLFAYWDGPWDPQKGPIVKWTDAYNAGGIKDYCDLIRASVRRYKDRIHYWQIWNEPNGRTDPATGREILTGFWKGTPQQYADMLKAAYETCKEEDPSCTVVGFNAALCDLEWLKLQFDLGMLNYADVVSYHPYRWLQRPEDKNNALVGKCFTLDHPMRWGDTVDEAHAVRQLIDQYASGKRLWITEYSWSAALNNAGMAEIDVARYYTRAMLLLLGPGRIEKVFWYDLRTHNVGLARPDFGPRYLSAAAATLARAINNKSFVRAYDVGEGNYAHLWSDGRQDLLALWTANPTPQFVTLSFQTPKAYTLCDMFGSEHIGGEGDSVQPMTIPLSQTVQFLTTAHGNVQDLTRVTNYLYELPRNFGPGPLPTDPYHSW